MPRRDRKRYSPDLLQFVDLANMLDKTTELLPKPWDRSAVTTHPLVSTLESRASIQRPTTPEDLQLAVASGNYSIRSSPVITTLGPRPVSSLALTGLIERVFEMSPVRRSSELAVTLRVQGSPFVLADHLALYELAYAVRSTLDAIIEKTEEAAASGFASVPIPVGVGFLQIIPGQPLRIELPRTLRLFLSALEGTHPERLRRCPVCSKLFVAQRVDAGGCSPRCCGIVRVWRLRGTAEKRKREIDTKAQFPEQISPEEATKGYEKRQRRRQRRKRQVK